MQKNIQSQKTIIKKPTTIVKKTTTTNARKSNLVATARKSNLVTTAKKSNVVAKSSVVAKNNPSVVVAPQQPVTTNNIGPATYSSIDTSHPPPTTSPSYGTLQTSYPMILMFPHTTIPPHSSFLITTTPSPHSSFLMTTTPPFFPKTTVLMYPPFIANSSTTLIENASYGNGTYYFSDPDNLGVYLLFNGIRFSAEITSGNSGIDNIGYNQYDSTTGYYIGTNSTIVNGSAVKGYWIEITLPVHIYLTDIIFYQLRKANQPSNVIVAGGTTSNNNFSSVATANSLSYTTIAGDKVFTRLSMASLFSYNRFRIIVTRAGYQGNDGIFYGSNSFSLAEIEIYGKEQLY